MSAVKTASVPTPVRSRAPASGRLTGIDVARALAIVGMLAVHVGPTAQGDLTGRLYALPHGRASLLFFVLAGVGVTLLGRSQRTSTRAAWVTLAWRAAVLLPAGLALQALDHGAYVVLPEYALLFLLAVVLLGVSDRWLLGLAASGTLVGSVVHLLGQMHDPATYARAGLTIDDSAWQILHGLVLSGPYPLVTWGVPFVVGLWLGRRDLTARSTRHRLIAVGAATTAGAWAVSSVLVLVLGDPAPPAGWDQLIARSAHSQMPLWLVGGTGSALFALGVCLEIAERAGRFVWPLAALGQLALTVYVGHLLALHLAPGALTADTVGQATAIVALMTAAAVALSTGWRSFASRGPLEVMLRPPVHLLARPRPAHASRRSST